jgi:Ca2+-binding EF-hand superfamily protein
MSKFLPAVAVFAALFLVAAKDDPFTFAALDSDASGEVSRAEVERVIRPMFEEIDSDRSGLVTKGEFRSFAMKKMMSGDRPAMMRGKRPKMNFDRNGNMGFQGFADGLWNAQFAPHDADGNGRLDSAEFAKRPK